MRSGIFVTASDNDLGIGKLVDIRKDVAIVEYFQSPSNEDPLVKEVIRNVLERVTLRPQTRAYCHNPETNQMEVGRVLAYQEEDDAYLVRFPNDQARMVANDDIQVRCQLPIAEPTDHLERQINETAFWHSARSNFVHHLLEQQRTNGGLSALMSSSIEIVAHQASVIRRVLMDPFQRYLLADEVGLGKTIEAGVLIKQFTIDEPDDHTTIVIVPEALQLQWQQELTHRFHLGSLLGSSIHIISSHNEHALRDRLPSARLVVVDEAHHLSSWAWSSNKIEKAIYDMVATATAELHRRVLLLSATPVLHNEESFLAMLHLLDPQVYALDKLNSFKKRVQLRQEIAERLMDLREDESNYFLGDTLQVLGDLLANDLEFANLRKQLLELIEDDVNEEDTRRIQLIHAIRTHVSDMWRLHRRILRSRRTESTDIYLPGRGGAIEITYSCDNETALVESVEEWRLNLSSSLFNAGKKEKCIASDLAREMDELASCDPKQAFEFASARLRNDGSNTFDYFPLYEGEIDSLNQIIRTAGQCDHTAKLLALFQLIHDVDDENSYVVFASESETADLIFEFLEMRMPEGVVLRHSSNQSEWNAYQTEPHGYILVCDRDAEEGLNLQKRGAWAVHYDLPFSPNRIEQRMGRLDRFGSGSPVHSAVMISKGSNIQKRWFELVDSTLGAFKRSIASLQYVIEEALQTVLHDFVDLGADAFVNAIDYLGGDTGIVAKEFSRIRAQDAIDSFDTGLVTQEIADEMEKNDLVLSKSAPKVFGDLIVRNLQFSNIPSNKAFAYGFNRRVDYGVKRPFGRDTLVPDAEFERNFSDSLGDVPLKPPTVFATVPFTFNRVTSQTENCRLLRVGDPFVDALEKFTRWDDRGISFAFWRHIPNFQSDDGPAVFFKFDFVVSPANGPLVDLCRKHNGSSLTAVQRRCRAIMHPRFTTMWLDADLNRVYADDERRQFLDREYNKKRTNIGQDFNLNRSRWGDAAKLYDMTLWRDHCVAARKQSEKLLREQSGLPELSNNCISQATRHASQVQQQFRSRLAIANGENTSFELELQFESDLLKTQIEAFRNPDLRADSVGAVFVSNQAPFVNQHTELGDQ
jgi:ATP-dependent helicase HepA